MTNIDKIQLLLRQLAEAEEMQDDVRWNLIAQEITELERQSEKN